MGNFHHETNKKSNKKLTRSAQQKNEGDDGSKNKINEIRRQNDRNWLNLNTQKEEEKKQTEAQRSLRA